MFVISPTWLGLTLEILSVSNRMEEKKVPSSYLANISPTWLGLTLGIVVLTVVIEWKRRMFPSHISQSWLGLTLVILTVSDRMEEKKVPLSYLPNLARTDSNATYC